MVSSKMISLPLGTHISHRLERVFRRLGHQSDTQAFRLQDYFLYFQTYCGPGYGWIRLYGVWDPTAISVHLILILIYCAKR